MPAITDERDMYPAIPAARVATREFVEPGPQRDVVGPLRTALKLGAPPTNTATRAAFGDRETILPADDRPYRRCERRRFPDRPPATGHSRVLAPPTGPSGARAPAPTRSSGPRPRDASPAPVSAPADTSGPTPSTADYPGHIRTSANIRSASRRVRTICSGSWCLHVMSVRRLTHRGFVNLMPVGPTSTDHVTIGRC